MSSFSSFFRPTHRPNAEYKQLDGEKGDMPGAQTGAATMRSNSQSFPIPEYKQPDRDTPQFHPMSAAQPVAHAPPLPHRHPHGPSDFLPRHQRYHSMQQCNTQTPLSQTLTQSHSASDQALHHHYGSPSDSDSQSQSLSQQHTPSYSSSSSSPDRQTPSNSPPQSHRRSPSLNGVPPHLSGRLTPVAIPRRHSIPLPITQVQPAQPQPDSTAPDTAADDVQSSSSSSRRRLLSPRALAEAQKAAAAIFPTDIGPSPRTAALRRAQPTPGGKNVIYQVGDGDRDGGEWKMERHGGGQMTFGMQGNKASTTSSLASAFAQRNDSFSSTTSSNSSSSLFGGSGVAKLRGKRKYSDPDCGVAGSSSARARLLPHHPATRGFAQMDQGGWRGMLKRVRNKALYPLAWMVRYIRTRNAKKDDNAPNSCLAAIVPFGATTTNATAISGMKGGKRCSWSRIVLSSVMIVMLSFFLIWYTHDCSHDHELEIDGNVDLSNTQQLLQTHGASDGSHLSAVHDGPLNPASEPGGIVQQWLGGSLSEFEQLYPFMHPVIHFFKRPLSDVMKRANGKAVVVARGDTSVPFTIVSLLRDMTPEFLSENKASYIFQYNALLSWLRVTPHVIVYMDSQSSCDSLTARKEFKSVRCFAVPCVHEIVPRPLLSCIFMHSHEMSTTEMIAFVNGDIVIGKELPSLVNKIASQFQHFVLVSKRMDTTMPDHLIDAYVENHLRRARENIMGVPFQPTEVVDLVTAERIIVNDNVDSVIDYSAKYGTMHSEFGIDLFFYPKSTFKFMFPEFPPFLAGIYRWDNYFLTKMILHPDVASIDASRPGLLIHQQVDGGQHHSKRVGAPINDALVKAQLGSVYKLGHINNVDFVLSGQCPQDCTMDPNVNASVQVLYAKRSNPHQWLGIIEVGTGEHVELNNFICWSNRVNFRNWLLLTRDKDMYDEIVGRELPAIFLDPALVPVEGESDAAGQASNKLDTPAHLLQRYDFLLSVLKAGYHFFYSSARSVFLTDPLSSLSKPPPLTPEGEIPWPDVQLRGNATHIHRPLHELGPLAVRSTKYGQYFWKQTMNCVEKEKASDKEEWRECLAKSWKTIKGEIRKQPLHEMMFPDAQTYFDDKLRSPLVHGKYPIAVLDESVSENADKFARLAQWGLLATKAATPVCKDELPSARASVFQPPTTKPEKDFRLKVRVLTFNRFASLKRLLDQLHTAYYDNDRVDLEISIDYPANMSDTETIAQWTRTQLVARSFAWNHGRVNVIQQRTHIGLTGQWTQGWYPAADNREIMLFLEDDTGVSPYYYRFCKKMIQTYYLDPRNYDPNLYGFSLQTQHTILGESLDAMYGSRQVPNLLNQSAIERGWDEEHEWRWYFRYQLVGTWGGVFFPQHWREFLIWLRDRQFVHAEGVSTSGFEPCVPGLISNTWWQKKPHKVWSQWFVRFAFEKGWYNLYTNYPDQLSLVGNFREGGENFAVAKGLMNDIVDERNTPPGSKLYKHLQTAPLPSPLSSLPLFDFHFRDVSAAPQTLRHRAVVWGSNANVAQCTTMAGLKKLMKEAAEVERIKEEKRKLKEARKKRESMAEDTSILSKLQVTMTQLQQPNNQAQTTTEKKKSDKKTKKKEKKEKKEKKADAIEGETDATTDEKNEEEEEKKKTKNDDKSKKEKKKKTEEKAKSGDGDAASFDSAGDDPVSKAQSSSDGEKESDPPDTNEE